VLIGLSPLPASAVTVCTPNSCAWNDIPDIDFATGAYTATLPVGVVTWQCVDDGDVDEGCILNVVGAPPVTLVLCTAGASGPIGGGFFNTLPREGMTSTCLFLQTPGSRVTWTAIGSTSGTIS
jgi:hypothetical protein